MRSLLDRLERLGNALPDPITLFALLTVAVVLVSSLGARAGLSVAHPGDGSAVVVQDLLAPAQIRALLTGAVRNFTGFAPLGTVLVAMLGIGVAEGSGLVAASLRAAVRVIPSGALPLGVVFVGVNASQAADAGLIVLPPLAAVVFAAMGRHPVAGIAAAFAGVSGGFSANLLPSTLDVLLVGFTQEAVDASGLRPGYVVHLLGNWYLMAAATPLLSLVGAWVTVRVVEPRLGPWTQAAPESNPDPGAPEGRALLLAAAGGLAVAMLLVGLWAAGPLRGEGQTLLASLEPVFGSLVVWVAALFFVPGVCYGLVAGTIRSDRDVARLLGQSMSTMGGYIALAFVAAQFVACFAASNLGTVLAVTGADGLRAMGLQGAPLLVGMVLLVASINLMIASASAKWAVMAPVLVPMLMVLGVSPEGTQAVFRVGDSCTNIITPLMPYLPFVLACTTRYDPRAGTGTMVALMLPYSVAFLLSWAALLMLFWTLDWPIGPGVGLRLPP
jgi:aminobenzoyl-glutamate transport protein